MRERSVDQCRQGCGQASGYTDGAGLGRASLGDREPSDRRRCLEGTRRYADAERVEHALPYARPYLAWQPALARARHHGRERLDESQRLILVSRGLRHRAWSSATTASGRTGEPVPPTSFSGLNRNANSRMAAAARPSRSSASMM